MKNTTFEIKEKIYFVINRFWPILLVIQWLFGPGPIRSGDSGGYKNPEVLIDFKRMLASLSGETTRSWPIVVPFELMMDDRVIVIAQWGLYGVAFALFLRAAQSFLTNLNLRILLTIALVSLFCSPFVMAFNSHILGESFTISYTVIGISCISYLKSDSQEKFPKIKLLVGLLACFIRPHLLLIFLPLIFMLLSKYLRSKPGKAKLFRTLASIGIVFVYMSFWWISNDRSWYESTPRQVFVATHTLSKYSPIEPNITKAVKETFSPPDCFPVAEGTAAQPEAVNSVIANSSTCPQSKIWGDGFQGWYVKYLALHPVDSVNYATWALPRFMSAPIQPGQLSALPNFLTELVTGTVNDAYPGGSRGQGLNDPRAFQDALPLVFLIALVSSIWGREKTVQARKLMYLAGLCLVGGVIGAFLMPSTLLEMARQGSAFALPFRAITILGVFLLGEIAFAMNRREKQNFDEAG